MFVLLSVVVNIPKAFIKFCADTRGVFYLKFFFCRIFFFQKMRIFERTFLFLRPNCIVFRCLHNNYFFLGKDLLLDVMLSITSGILFQNTEIEFIDYNDPNGTNSQKLSCHPGSNFSTISRQSYAVYPRSERYQKFYSKPTKTPEFISLKIYIQKRFQNELFS